MIYFLMTHLPFTLHSSLENNPHHDNRKLYGLIIPALLNTIGNYGITSFIIMSQLI